MNDQSAISSPNHRWGSRVLVVLFVALVAPLALTLLYVYYDPRGVNPYFPGCYFKEWTGLSCPGCGATRSLYSLLHLDLMQALAYNPFFVLILPYLLFGLAEMLYTVWTGKRPRGARAPRWTTKFLLIVIFAYWILRNIDVYPLTLLAPHELNLPS
jgi:hypothetical protein